MLLIVHLHSCFINHALQLGADLFNLHLESEHLFIVCIKLFFKLSNFGLVIFFFSFFVDS